MLGVSLAVNGPLAAPRISKKELNAAARISASEQPRGFSGFGFGSASGNLGFRCHLFSFAGTRFCRSSKRKEFGWVLLGWLGTLGNHTVFLRTDWGDSLPEFLETNRVEFVRFDLAKPRK